MGLAASQARFLELTSRKSNIEFQGQQINQQRTTLSNVSAGYNEQLMTLSVPTAPSTQDYTKVSYSYTDASGANYDITSLTSLGQGKYRIDYDESYTGETADNLSVKLQYSDGKYLSPTNQGSVGLSNVDMTKATVQQTLKVLYGDDYASTTTTTENYRNSYYGGTSTNGKSYYYNNSTLSSITDGTSLDINGMRITNTNGVYTAQTITYNNKFYRSDDNTVISATEFEKLNLKVGETTSNMQALCGAYSYKGTVYSNNYNNTWTYNSDGTYSFNSQSYPKTFKLVDNSQINASDAQLYNTALSTANQTGSYNDITLGDPITLSNVDLSTVEDNSDEAKALQDVTTSGNYNDKDTTTTTTPNSYQYYTYNGKTYYINSNDLTSDKNVTVKSKLTDGTITESGHIDSAYVEMSGSRLIAFSETDPDVENAKDRVKLTVSTTTDTNAYEDAMNKWTYNKQVYDKTMTDINAKMSIVQQQDKSLELKLRELDTEQQAVSTEMDAVKKVADKNVESTFKTFNA